jgi:hypothetical protein
MLNFPKGCLSTLVPSLVLGGAMGATAVLAQTQSPESTAPSSFTDLARPNSANPDDRSRYATGKPLENSPRKISGDT